jgi:4-hydroxybenzoate polyprenyltransferase
MALALPLALDFDGTLHRSDVFWEGVLWLAKQRPLQAFKLLVLVLVKGKVAAKLALQSQMRAAPLPTLPWDERVIEAARAAEAQKRTVLVATGSPQEWVEDILKAKGLNWRVVGTTATSGNVVGRIKASKLVAEFGDKGFDYAGNSTTDGPVWAAARGAWVANASRKARALAGPNILQEFASESAPLAAWRRALRPHQWLKNTLVFVPLLAAHLWLSMPDWGFALLTFIAFSLAASGAYIVNDLLDLEADRAHPRKCQRPFASGALPLHQGLAAAFGLVATALLLALLITPSLAGVLLMYVGLTFGYSMVLKHHAVADAAALAVLWVLRLLGGAVAVAVPLSQWLMLFAFLMFYSLALLKRYVELRDLPNRNATQARGYAIDDTAMVAMQGIATGMLAALVIALYVASPDVGMLYTNPAWLMPIPPLMIWWVGRIWLLAHKGAVHEDPIVFAVTDKLTLLAAAFILLIAILGSGL